MRSFAALALLVLAATALAGDEKKPPAPAKAPAAPAGADDPEIKAATEDYDRRMGTKLRVVVKGRFVVRGDNELPDLERIAEACEATLTHFLQVSGGGPDDVFPPRNKGQTGNAGAAVRVEVFQFVREKAYLDLLDKVIARIRDDTVDDRKLELMRRQRGFMIQSPRYVFAQYQGPSEMASCVSQAVHKTSHLCMLSWKRTGGWQPWWLLEGVAAWQEMAVLRESRTYCIDVDRPGDYAKKGTPEADEAAKARMEDVWRAKVRAMIRNGTAVRLPTLALRSLNELVYEDVMQSWSIVDWLWRTRKLKDFIAASKEKRQIEPTCEAALGKSAGAVDHAWQAWALGDAR